MANLRNLIDGKAVDTSDKNDVFQHLKKVTDAKTNYDMAKTQLHTKLAPTRMMLNLIDKQHPMDSDNPNGQEIDPETGQPMQQQQNNTMKPGMATNPNNMNQATNQNVKQENMGQQPKKPGFPNANKTSTKDKLTNANNKNKKDKDKNGRGFEVHVKAGSKKKKIKANDYHDDAGMSQMPSRGIGLSGGGPGSGRRPGVGNVNRYTLDKKAITRD